MPTGSRPPSGSATSWYRAGSAAIRIAAPPPVDDALRRTLVDLAVGPPRSDEGRDDVDHTDGPTAQRDSVAEPDIEITVVPIEAGYRVEHPRGSGNHASAATAVDGVISALNLTTLYASQRHAHLHAGGLTAGDGAILLTAPSGAGKSTLVTAAVEAGFGYLSDERIGIDATGLAHPYHKPLSLKQASWPLLPHLQPNDAGDDHRIWQIPASRISPEIDGRPLAGPTTPRLVLRVRHEPDAAPRFEPISRGAAAAAMVLNSMDFDVIGPDTIVWFGRALATARTGTLVSGCLAPTVGLLRALAAEAVESGPEPELVAVATRGGPHTGSAEEAAITDVPGLRDGTTVVSIDDELLVHEPQTRQVVVLNPAAGAIVAGIDGERTWAGLAAVTGSSHDAVLALAVELGTRGMLAGARRTTEPPTWHDLTQAAKRYDEDDPLR